MQEGMTRSEAGEKNERRGMEQATTKTAQKGIEGTRHEGKKEKQCKHKEQK